MLVSVEIFLSALKRLTEQNLTVVELISAAEALKGDGEPQLVAQLYRIWIAYNKDDPLCSVIHFNLSVLLSEQGDLSGAKQSLEQAIASNANFYPAYINLGRIYETLGQSDQAIVQWSQVVNRLPSVTAATIGYKTSALKQIGRVLQGSNLAADAEAVLQQSLTINPTQTDVARHFIALRQRQCKWPIVAPWEGVDRKTLMGTIEPLSMAAYTDDPMFQLACAWNYNRSWDPPPYLWDHSAKRRQPAGGRRRIGYVSSDLRQHAIGYLMAELFELHDRNAIEVFVYYCGPAAEDPIKARIRAAVEHWTDISAMDDLSAANRIVADRVDILVDVNGNTRDMRTTVFAMHPAPVMVNWLGFPGTMGSPYHHYIIADDWIIPKEHEIFFSEKVLRLPCYQPNDRKRAISTVRPTRAAAGLPEDAVVYCCFNGSHKISRFTFERWMAILKRVPNSVLWLLGGLEAVQKTLRDLAGQHGIAPERLVYAPPLPSPDHLARYPLADIFLDTTPYGAHTTASDAMWMGVPIVTLSGRSFASRVCGSLARAAGLADLVCTTPEDYVERAVALGNDRTAVARYKKHLEAVRDTCVLFDMDGLVRHLEALYRQIWEEYQHGALPRPDLSNLDAYFEVGLDQDHDEIEVMTVLDYHAWYRAKLARRHRYRPIAEDQRLWTAADIAAVEGEAPPAQGVAMAPMKKGRSRA